jgi:predicted enzyme related to lactoylglutathione lyase
MTNPANPRRGGSPLADAVSESSEGVLVPQMLIVSDLGRSVAFYREVLGATVERANPPAMLRLYNAWLVLNVGGGPTDGKPRVTVTTPTHPTIVSSFLNIRVADIESVYALWSSRGAHFITTPSTGALRFAATCTTPTAT